MFAVIKTGGKQYRVAPGDVIDIEKLEGAAGENITFTSVLMHGGGADVTVGTPFVDGAEVVGEVLDQFRGKKVVGLKKRRRKHSSARRWGHRQSLTKVRISSIPGQTLEDVMKAKAAAPKAAPKTAPAAAQEDGMDDLTKLPGVTAEAQATLNEMGINSYAQVANWGPSDWEKVDAALSEKHDGMTLSRASVLTQANRLIETRSAAANETAE